MKKIATSLFVAAALAIAAPAFAAPQTPAEKTTVEKRERHDFRDAQTGDFRSHGGLSKEAKDAYASSPKSNQAAPAINDPYTPTDRLTNPQ